MRFSILMTLGLATKDVEYIRAKRAKAITKEVNKQFDRIVASLEEFGKTGVYIRDDYVVSQLIIKLNRANIIHDAERNGFETYIMATL